MNDMQWLLVIMGIWLTFVAVVVLLGMRVATVRSRKRAEPKPRLQPQQWPLGKYHP